MKRTKYVIVFYFLIFLYFYFFTLNFNYVEGDDASTILYHLCGRNLQIQYPYAAYNSGIDFLIKTLNIQGEESLRTFAILVSFISGFLILSLLVLFLDAFFDRNEFVNSRYKTYLYLFIPFIIPDIIFHSLIVNSAYIGFVFFAGSLLLFIKFLKTNQIFILALSTLLFAIAIPFRWTLFVSLPVYIGLALYYNLVDYNSKKTWLLLYKIAIANLLGVFLAILFIYVTGYDLQGIYNTIISCNNYLKNIEVSLFSIFAIGSAFLTPALLFLVLLSFFKIYELNQVNNKYMISIVSLVLLSISPFFIFGFSSSFKFLITLLPILLIIMVLGFDYLIKRKWLFIIFLILVASPWFIGIQINAKGTFCGPGFELNKKNNDSNKSLENNPDKRIQIEGVHLRFDSGFYLPMLEGPRPFYGYFYVLFGNGWKNQIDLFTNEREKIFKVLMQNKNIVYIQDRRTAYFQCDLFRKGFVTQTDFIDNDSILFRKYKNKEQSINIYVIPDNYSKVEWISNYLKTAKNTVIYRSSYSNEILKLYYNNENHIDVLGPFTAIKYMK